MRSATAALLAVGLAVTTAGCVSASGSLGDAMHAWRNKRTAAALAHASDEYARFRDANGLDEGEIRRVVDGARRDLAERPIVAGGRLPPPVPMASDRPGALRDAIREDLLSGRVTAILRAVASVEGLGLRAHAPELLAIVYRREPVEPDGGLLEDASVALRSVAVKRAALDALTSFAAR